MSIDDGLILIDMRNMVWQSFQKTIYSDCFKNYACNFKYCYSIAQVYSRAVQLS